MILRLNLSALLLACSLYAAEIPKSPARLNPDERYKVDILLVVAHPDDDIVIGPYLAKASLEEHKRIAVIYCTSGDGGGNEVGNEAGASLGQMRIIEARKALASLGIDNVWFLGGHDTPGQDPLRSLDAWGHGHMLDEIVRLVRITRPEVFMAWLPNQVVGENHGDHQASGVLATEAFDEAGDATRFPAQISAARDRTGMSNLTEGLQPWQPKKLYYFTDAFEDFGPYWHNPALASPFRENFLKGNGPSYPVTEKYARLTAQQQVFYMTQEGSVGVEALRNNGIKEFAYPVQLLFGKSVVGGVVTGDVFENIAATAVPFAPVKGFRPEADTGLSIEVAGPWEFYRRFWKAHDIENIARLIPIPEMSADGGRVTRIPMLIRNNTSEAQDIRLDAKMPEGWRIEGAPAIYPVAAGGSYPLYLNVAAVRPAKPEWHELVFTISTGGREAGSVTVRTFTGKSGVLPQ